MAILTTLTTRHPNKKTKESYTVTDDGLKNGAYKSFYESGTKFEEHEFLDNNFHGSFKKYYENGKIGIECTYKNNKLDGSFKRYDENSILIEELTYKNGILIVI